MNVADEVDEELERLGLGLAFGLRIVQDLLETLNRRQDVSLRGTSGGLQGLVVVDAEEVPGRRLLPIRVRANVVRPGADLGEALRTNQRRHTPLRLRSQVMLRDP